MSNEKEIINRNSRENSSNVVDKILKDVTRLYDEYAVMSLRRKIAIDAILCEVEEKVKFYGFNKYSYDIDTIYKNVDNVNFCPVCGRKL